MGFHLGETCRQDFLEIAFLAVNGYGTGAQKLLRGLYERAVTLEYIRTHPETAERFVRYAAIQEFKAANKALEVVTHEQFDAVMGSGPNSFANTRDRYEQVKPEFKITTCKKCGTKETAFSWGPDIASMVNVLGEPYKHLYLGSYTIPTLQIHATLASAFSLEAVEGTREARNIHDAEFSLMSATLVFLSVIRSQNAIFALNLEQEIETCEADVGTVWVDRPK